MSTLLIKGSELKTGYRLSTGGVVVGFIAIVKGGYKYRILQADGREIDAVYDGRRNYAILVEEQS